MPALNLLTDAVSDCDLLFFVISSLKKYRNITELYLTQTHDTSLTHKTKGIDVSSDDIGATLQTAFKDIKLDIFLNNSGILTPDTQADFAPGEKMMEACLKPKTIFSGR